MGSMNEYCIPGDAILGPLASPQGCALVATPNVTIGGQELFAMDLDNAAVFEGLHGYEHESSKPCLPELTDLEDITIQGQSKMVSVGAAAACGSHAYGRIITNQAKATLLEQIGIH